MADAASLLTLLAGLLDRRLPAAGHRGEQSGDRATLSLTRRLLPAAGDGLGPGALERDRFRLGQRAPEGGRCSGDANHTRTRPFASKHSCI